MTTSSSSDRTPLPGEAAPSRPSRRNVLAGGAAMAAAGSIAVAERAAANTDVPNPSNWGAWFLGRVSFGVTPSMIQDLNMRGVRGWVDWQLEPQLIDDSDLNARLGQFDWMGQSVVEMWNHPTKQGRVIGYEARALRIIRATYSKRQLFERIVEFWTDHFNVFGSADDLWLLKIVDDREVIRANALGTFRDLLQASAKSPAMIEYLDNATNFVGRPQENYAREVMELHTLGVDGPYTEQDVRELARCMTGWNYWQLIQSPTQYGSFRFRSSHHDMDAKQVLGLDIPAGGGLSDAETVFDHLANHPSTIDFVTTKLANWLLGYDAPTEAIEAGKARWVATGGDIKEIVRTLLRPRFVRQAAPWDEPKLKRPLHWIVSLYRATGVDLPNPVGTVVSTRDLGQTPFDWHAPTGFPDVEEAWSSLVISRWNYAANFCRGDEPSMPHTIDDLRALLGTTPMDAWARRIAVILTGDTMHPRDLKRVQAYIDTFAAPTDDAVAEAFELVASSPSFGRY